MKTIETPNQTATISIRKSHKGGYYLDCSFWPLSQPAFFTKFERKFHVSRVLAMPTAANPGAALVYFNTTPDNMTSFLDDIETLFLDNYEP